MKKKIDFDFNWVEKREKKISENINIQSGLLLSLINNKIKKKEFCIIVCLINLKKKMKEINKRMRMGISLRLLQIIMIENLNQSKKADEISLKMNNSLNNNSYYSQYAILSLFIIARAALKFNSQKIINNILMLKIGNILLINI